MGIIKPASSRTNHLQPIGNPERNELLRRTEPDRPPDNAYAARMDRARSELAHAPRIRTIDWPMVELGADLGGES